MLKIENNFSNSSSILRGEKRKRSSNEFTPDEELENKLWIFLHDLGFNQLNVGRACKIEYGSNPKNLTQKSIDIIAESKDGRIFVECSTQKDTNEKIKEWIFDVNSIRKFSNLDNKNVSFCFFTDQSLTGSEIKKLEVSGIKIITLKKIEYLEKLIKLHKRLAYFQFLGYVFRGQGIKNLTDSTFTVPAIETKYTSKERCYFFGIQPSKLIPLTTVLHRNMDDDSKNVNSYQRLIKKEKINSIRKFILEEGGVFPTNIILSFKTKNKNFFSSKGSINEIKFGTLTLPHQFHSITVIDGQHRLFAYDGLKEAENHLIYVIAFNEMSIDKQIETFIDINEKQTKVSSSLMWDLYPSILDDSDIRSRISVISKTLNTADETDALYQMIKYDSAPPSKKAKVTLETICTAIKTNRLVFDIEFYLSRLGVRNYQDKNISIIIASFFNAVRDIKPDLWNRDDKSLNVLASNQAIGALIRLNSKILDYLYKKDNLSALKNKEYSELKNEMIELLKPVIEKVNSLKTKDEIKDYIKVGEKGKKEIFLDFVKCINQRFNDFGQDIIEANSGEEFEDLLSKLREDDEHLNIEAKESFFANCDRFRKDGVLEKNQEGVLSHTIKTIAAFANFKGGDILLGVKDVTWEPVGLENTDIKLYSNWDSYKNALTNKISGSLEGLIKVPEIKKHVYKGKTFGLIKVKSIGKLRFESKRLVSLKENNNPYKRENGRTIALKIQDINDYCQEVLSELENEEEELSE